MDVYALGLVLHEAIAGAHPIVTEPGTVFQICAAQLNNHPPPLARVAPWAPPELAAAVDRAVEKDPNRRPPSITALANALADCIERSSGPPSAAAPASAGGFSASAPTPVIATGSLRALRGPGGTQVMAATTASIPSPTAEGAVIAPGAPLSTSAVFGPTAPVPGAITEPAPADPTTMPVVVKPPATAAAPAPAAPRSRAKVVAVVATAALLGLGGGTWGVIELVGALRARSVPPASPSAKPSAAPPKGKAR
jgi:serine/threonine-protein kinase